MPAFIPTLYLGDYPYLGKAVEALTGSREMERIIFEWIAVSNKIIIADSVDLDDAAAIRNALLKTSALLNLGLEIACMEEMKKPADIFSASPLEDLVRLANSTIRGLSSHIRRLIKKSIIPSDLSFIQAPWLEILQGLLFERPLLWDPISAIYRAPVSLAEINSTKEICRLVEDTGLIISSLSPHWSKWETAFLWKDTNLKNSKELTWDIALITALSQKALGNNLVICPVSKNQLHDLYKIWFNKEKGEPFKHIIPWAETVLEPITAKVHVPSNVISRLIIRPVLDLREEMVNVFENGVLDAKYISKLFMEI